MEPLIKITSIPISIELKVNNAKLQYPNATADLELSRSKGGLSIKSSPIKLNLDTFEARNSVTPSPFRSIDQYAQKGRSAAYEATAAYASEGKLLLRAKIGEDVIGQIAESRFFGPLDYGMDFGLQFLPKARPEISWSEPDLSIQYQMDKLNFDWRIDSGDFQFTPGNIEVSITQRPQVLIEYIGGPIYVPPSADPEYIPIDTKA